MTPEQRLDRLERIAKLFVRAGQRARRQMRDQTKEVNRLVNLQNHLVNLQIGNEHRFERSEEKLNILSEKTERTFAELANAQALSEQKITGLAQAQTVTEHKLSELIDIIRKGRNGDSSVNNN
jgi:hypothetical protein